MAVHLKLRFTEHLLLLVSYIAAVLSDPASRQDLSHNTSQSPIAENIHQDYFPNERLYKAYLVIQSFKSTITSDPKNITASWTGHDICGEKSYLGFYCATPPGLTGKLTVTEVLLNGFGLRAPMLQGFIDQLPDIALFHAASNNFGGDIPQLDSLPYLYEFNIANNASQPLQPSGSFLDGSPGFTISNPHKGPPICVNSVYLNFTFHISAGNATSGGLIPGIPNPRIPGLPDHPKFPGIPGVTDAKALLLNYNNLSGSLPANLGLSKLSYLALANNKLTGPIPSSISHLQDSLFELLLLNNQLSGCLPHELGMLHKATVVDAGMNQLTGPIPSSFSCLTSVEQLNLAGNRLYGQVPDALCKLAGPAGRLANLTLSGNYFTSVAPACAALIKDGVMDVKNNCIPGLANQRRPAECAAFQMSQQPKTCPAASTRVACPAAVAAMGAVAPGEKKAREYSSYVTYATLHE